MKATLNTGPTSLPVSLPEIKDHLRLQESFTTDDAHISRLISSAVAEVEQLTRRRLFTQTWIYYLDAWPNGDAIALPFGQLQSVSSVKYKDSDGSESTMDSGDYIVDTDSEPCRVVLAYGESWPGDTLYPSNPIYVQFVCGYSSKADIPEPIKQAIKVIVARDYEQREPFIIGTIAMKNIDTIGSLLRPYIVHGDF